MLRENQCEMISDYENLKTIPYPERCTEYSKDFGMYVFKLDASPERVNARYAEAKSFIEGRVAANGQKLTAVLVKTIAGNITDKAMFQLSAEEELLQQFAELDVQEKRLGVQIGEELYLLLRQEKDLPVEMLTLPFGVCENRYLERLDAIRGRWLRRLTLWKEQDYREQIKKAASNEEKLKAKQDNFPYAKEIKKRMEECDKLFREQRMEGYDFRETDLQNAVFFHCKLANSNFSGVNLENVIFLCCDLTGCIWYGAHLNNCVAYARGEMLRLADRIRVNVVT